MSFRALVVCGLDVAGSIVPSAVQVSPPSVERAKSLPPLTSGPPPTLNEQRMSPPGSCTACGKADSRSSMRPVPSTPMYGTLVSISL